MAKFIVTKQNGVHKEIEADRINWMSCMIVFLTKDPAVRNEGDPLAASLPLLQYAINYSEVVDIERVKEVCLPIDEGNIQ